MHVPTITALAAFAATALALATPHTYVSHEKRSASLKKWVRRSEVPQTASLPIRIGLKQSNIDNGKGDELLHEM